MIASIAIQTEPFIGHLHTDAKRKNHFTFDTKEAFWNHLTELGKKLHAQKKKLTIYAHELAWTYYQLVPYNEPTNIIKSSKPFIAAHTIQGKEDINFYDIAGIYRMELYELATLLEKLPCETYTLQEQCELILESIQRIKQELSTRKIQTRRLITIHQIAISALINDLKLEEPKGFFYNVSKGQVNHTQYPDEIHEAYRGGRVEAFATGLFKNAQYIDCNSLYPYVATTMRFPVLNSEQLLHLPLNTYSADELFTHIGIAKCVLQNTACTIGLLPIRGPTTAFYPKQGTTLCGTWTHDELRVAVQNGYELKHVEWSIIWKETTNPLQHYFLELYEKRKNASSPWNNYFYKSLMNSAIGKFGQRKNGQHIVLDSVEEIDTYIADNYVATQGHGLSYVYEKKLTKTRKKPYYAPIIPTLINAHARIHLFEYMKTLDPTQLLYTDTDSILTTQPLSEIQQTIPIGTRLGEFKIVHENETVRIYGKKTYGMETKITVAGIRNPHITFGEFLIGLVEDTKLVSIKTQTDEHEAGTYTTTIRDLHDTERKHQEEERKLKDIRVFTDYRMEPFKYYKIYT